MLMANLKAVLTRPKVSENYSRNAFDRSFSPKFSYQVGALQPFMAEQCIAGSHIKLNRSIFQRTPAVNTAAFPKVDTHCEFFYVPLRLLWSYWNDYKLKIQDYNTSYMGTFNSSGGFSANGAPVLPTFDLNDVRDNILVRLSSGSLIGNNYFNTKREAVEANRLLDGLGYGFVKGTETRYSSSDYSSFTVNAFKLLAYQKVYYDHFRNTSYETNDPSYYNWDYWSHGGVSMPYQIVSKACTYRYVNYRRDYFTSLYPSLNYVVSNPSGLSWTIPASVQFQLNANSSINGTSTGNGQTVLFSTSNSAGNVGFTVQQIRAAFALDKLLRASAYTPKHVKDQFEARYGVRGVESGNESVRIGAFMSDIIFREVVNQSKTATTPLGVIGAQGVGSSSFEKDIEFTCKEDCIILGLCYSLPRSSYDSTMVKNWNMKIAAEDFFIPEYMNLGMQPLYHGELQYENNDATANMLPLGYQDRYLEYKLGIDVNHGLFNSNMALSDFVVHSGTGRSFTGSGVSTSYFKVNPRDMDAIFVQSTATDDMTTDKFITYMDVKFICNQNMSVHGQPISVS